MPPFDLDQLPTEIKERIVQHCSNRNLLQLSISNRELCHLATRYLYRDVPAFIDSKQTIIFLLSVFFSDRTALLIRRLSLDLSTPRFVSEGGMEDVLPYAKALGKVEGKAEELELYLTLQDAPSLIIHVLKKMRGLEHLDLISRARDRHPYLRRSTILSALADDNAFKLHSFHTSFETSPGMKEFVAAHTSLREFCFWGPGSPDLPKEALPPGSLENVTTLGWTVSYNFGVGGVPNLVKRRMQDQSCQPVTTVVVDLAPLALPARKLLVAAYMDVGLAAKGWITSATISFSSFLQASNVLQIVDSFPSLENLRIKVENFNTGLPRTVIPCLQNLPRLRHLVLYGACMLGMDMKGWETRYRDREAQYSKDLADLHVTVFCVHKFGKRAYYRIARPEPGCVVCAKLCDPNLYLGPGNDSIF